MKRLLWGFIGLLTLASPGLAEDVENPPAGYKEIPYYVRKLEETQLEDERVRYDKTIHDAIVNADLSSKKIVQEMEPMIDRVQKAMDSGLDRLNITGQTYWLASAVDYFDREKLAPVVAIPDTDWLPNESQSKDGATLSTYPEKVLVHKNGVSEIVAEDSGIHEAILSTDGRWLAYYRLVDAKGTRAEICVVNVATKKKRKIASVPSCYTLLFSLNGARLFYQAVPQPVGSESDVFVVSRGGGRPKKIGSGTLLQTVVEKGRYKGDLILYRKNLHHLGISQLECPYAITPSGVNIGRIVNAACR